MVGLSTDEHNKPRHGERHPEVLEGRTMNMFYSLKEPDRQSYWFGNQGQIDTKIYAIDTLTYHNNPKM